MTEHLRTFIELLILLALSSFFSSTETAYSAVSRARLKKLSEDGERWATRALKQLEEFDEVLSAVLIGNNLVNIASSAIATIWFMKHVSHAPLLVSTIIMTLTILVFGEITPKSFAKERPERFVHLAVYPMQILMFLFLPLNRLFLFWKRKLTQLFHFEQDSQQMTGDELLCLVEEAAQDGGITQEAGELLRSAIEFRDMEAASICTPRVKMVAVSEGASAQDVERVFAESGYSRLPVFRRSIDDIVGFINLKDFYTRAHTANFHLGAIMKPTLFFASTQRIHSILRQMQKQKIQLGIVTDEFGGTLGLLTMEDILEELVGEIYDEQDEVPESFKGIGKDLYLVDCDTELEPFQKKFQVEIEAEATTVGGWLREKFGRIPVVGEHCIHQNLELKIRRANAKCALEVQVRVLPPLMEVPEE